MVDIGLKFYAVPSWPTLGDLEVKVTDLEILKFFFKDLRSLYLLNMLMDQVDTFMFEDIGLKFYGVPS